MMLALLHLNSVTSCTAYSQLAATSASDVQQSATVYFRWSLAIVVQYRRSRSRLCQQTATERSPVYQQLHQLERILAWPLQVKHC